MPTSIHADHVGNKSMSRQVQVQIGVSFESVAPAMYSRMGEAAEKHKKLVEKQQEWQALGAHQKVLAKQLKALKRQQTGMKIWIGDVAFVLFVWSCPCTLMAQAFLDQRQKDSPGLDLGSVVDLQERYLSVDLTTLTSIQAARTEPVDRKSKAAARFEREYNLVKWIEHSNMAKGIAPTTHMVVTHLAGKDDVLPASHESPDGGSATVSTKWVQRFRHRWCMRRGSFQARDHIPVEELRAKV